MDLEDGAARITSVGFVAPSSLPLQSVIGFIAVSSFSVKPATPMCLSNPDQWIGILVSAIVSRLSTQLLVRDKTGVVLGQNLGIYQ